MSKMLLTVKNLRTHFITTKGVVRAVDGVSFGIERGESLALVGESGSGKSVTAMSILKLVSSSAKIEGEILYNGQDLVPKSEREMQDIRGKNIAMVFQDPATFLNPVLTVGDQIAEAIRLHQKGLDEDKIVEKAIEMMRLVEISSPQERFNDYPHQLSGGMQQRIMIAIALSCRPELLIADEPTTALDVLIQDEILELIKQLKKTMNMALLLITHDLGIVAELADKIAVIYAGQIVEYGYAIDIYTQPKHPYTIGLLETIPRVDVRSKKLKVIDGWVPEPMNLPSGCRFHPRCPYFEQTCAKLEQKLDSAGKDHYVACWKHSNLSTSKVKENR